VIDIVCEEHYSFFGAFNNAMCLVRDDFELVNIGRSDDSPVSECVRKIDVVEEWCSSREAYERSVFRVACEDRLVYLREKATPCRDSEL